MWTAVVTAVGALIGWLALELIWELIREGVVVVSGPIWRPIRRSFVEARWPWPLFLMLVVGTNAGAAGLQILASDERWFFGALGGTLFFGGSLMAVASPFVWRDAQLERAGTDVTGKQRDGR
jgi:hypothetical protein